MSWISGISRLKGSDRNKASFQCKALDRERNACATTYTANADAGFRKLTICRPDNESACVRLCCVEKTPVILAHDQIFKNRQHLSPGAH